MKALLAVFVSLCLILVYLVITQAIKPVAVVVPDDLDNQKLWLEVAEWRKSVGVGELKESELLCKYAQKRLEDNALGFSHNGFHASRSAQIFSEAKNMYQKLGENLSQDFGTNKGVLYAWVKSETHRENLKGNYTDSCIRCNSNTCVQLFAR